MHFHTLGPETNSVPYWWGEGWGRGEGGGGGGGGGGGAHADRFQVGGESSVQELEQELKREQLW